MKESVIDVGYPLLVIRRDGLDTAGLRSYWDTVRDRMGAPGAVVVGTVNEGKPMIMAAGTEQAVALIIQKKENGVRNPAAGCGLVLEMFQIMVEIMAVVSEDRPGRTVCVVLLLVRPPLLDHPDELIFIFFCEFNKFQCHGSESHLAENREVPAVLQIFILMEEQVPPELCSDGRELDKDIGFNSGKESEKELVELQNKEHKGRAVNFETVRFVFHAQHVFEHLEIQHIHEILTHSELAELEGGTCSDFRFLKNPVPEDPDFPQDRIVESVI